MVNPYIPPPTVEQVCRDFALHISAKYSVKVSITVDDGNGNQSTLTINKPELRGLEE